MEKEQLEKWKDNEEVHTDGSNLVMVGREQPGPSSHLEDRRRKDKCRRRERLRWPLASVVFFPSTRGGTLVRKLKDREETLAGITGFGIKFQEAGGTQLGNLFNTNLGKGLHCTRNPCPTCDITTKEQKEWLQGQEYSIWLSRPSLQPIQPKGMCVGDKSLSTWKGTWASQKCQGLLCEIPYHQALDECPWG